MIDAASSSTGKSAEEREVGDPGRHEVALGPLVAAAGAGQVVEPAVPAALGGDGVLDGARRRGSTTARGGGPARAAAELTARVWGLRARAPGVRGLAQVSAADR